MDLMDVCAQYTQRLVKEEKILMMMKRGRVVIWCGPIWRPLVRHREKEKESGKNGDKERSERGLKNTVDMCAKCFLLMN